MAQHGHFFWNELMTRDLEGAKAFYGAQIGWAFDAMPMPEGGTYWVCKIDGQPVAGILDMSEPRFEGVPPQWFAYLAVDDVDARVQKATAAGAKLARPIFDIEGVGRVAILHDPTGAAIGWITPARQA